MTWFSSRIDDSKERYIAANAASDGSTAIDGTWASGGRSARICATRALMSASAAVASKLSFSRTLMVDSPCVLCESM